MGVAELSPVGLHARLRLLRGQLDRRLDAAESTSFLAQIDHPQGDRAARAAALAELDAAFAAYRALLADG